MVLLQTSIHNLNLNHDAFSTMTKITIEATENGPYVVKDDGKTVAALCRCGASNNKPNCDGSHTNIGFKAKASKLEV